jgi:hypothetical protein
MKQSDTGCANITAGFNRGFWKELTLGKVFWARPQSNRGGSAMRRAWGMTLLLGAGVGLFLGPQQVQAQACKDEVSMVESSKQSFVELTETVKKESLADFQRLNQQKSVLNKLTINNSMLDELVSCLEKAAQDATAPKEQVEAAKAQHDAYVKLQDKLQHARAAIKAAQSPKDAKALIEKLDLTP